MHFGVCQVGKYLDKDFLRINVIAVSIPPANCIFLFRTHKNIDRSTSAQVSPHGPGPTGPIWAGSRQCLGRYPGMARNILGWHFVWVLILWGLGSIYVYTYSLALRAMPPNLWDSMPCSWLDDLCSRDDQDFRRTVGRAGQHFVILRGAFGSWD